MTDTYDTAELKRLMEAGTPGPWFVSGVRVKMNRSDWHGIQRYNEATKQDDNICCVGYDPRTGEGHADARLIVAAINALPELVAMARRVAELEGALKPFAAMVSNHPEMDAPSPVITLTYNKAHLRRAATLTKD